MIKIETLKEILAFLSFIAALCFGVAGMFMPPLGVISPSVLIWLAQLLVFCSMLLGYSAKDNEIYKELVNILKEIKK